MRPHLLLGVVSSRHYALENSKPPGPGPEEKTHNGKENIIIRGSSNGLSVEETSERRRSL